ncbi:hypothetical protein RMATCC62417_17008 [Rhizopus microsporus]|nr:hypothetical protein RMATCC62417_17008 [Rhizopus microsporus]
MSIDIFAAEHAVITGAFGSAVSIQWRFFHVSRAWMDQVRKKVKLGSVSANNAVHRSMIAALKSLMWKSSSKMFVQKLLHFLQDSSVHMDIMAHFTQKYLIDDKFMHWSAAYQPKIFTNMEINNYVESWHSQLKTNYLQRKRNRRLDYLLFVLVDDIHTDFMYNTARMAANIGRMNSETKEVRKRMVAAEETNELALEDMTQKVYIDKESAEATQHQKEGYEPTLDSAHPYDEEDDEENRILSKLSIDCHPRRNCECTHTFTESDEDPTNTEAAADNSK